MVGMRMRVRLVVPVLIVAVIRVRVMIVRAVALRAGRSRRCVGMWVGVGVMLVSAHHPIEQPVATPESSGA